MTDRAPCPPRTSTAIAVLFLVLAVAAGACGTGSPSKGTAEEAQAGAVTSTTIYGPEYLAPAAPGSPSSSSVPPSTAPPTTATTRTSPPAPAPTVPPTPAPGPALPAGDDRAVERIVDGDTIVVTGGVRVRLIGINTPETVDPQTSVECFGPEASRHIAELLPAGTRVRLAYDVDRTDQYGRTLAYVYRLSDGLFVNVALVRDGFAQTATYPPNVAHVDEIRAAETEAREADRGLWGGCPSGGSTSTTVVPAPTSGGGACDPSYPDVCIPPGPPDLDCGEISYKRFRVVGSDPHRFDSDHDGVGCES